MPGEYDDIIYLPHHQSPTRPRMSPLNRAAQFAPFAALSGHDAAIRETARQTQPRAELTEEERSVINAKLQLLQNQLALLPVVTVTYFREDDRKPGGAYLRKTGTVIKVDAHTSELIFQDGSALCFYDLFDIQGSIFPEQAPD